MSEKDQNEKNEGGDRYGQAAKQMASAAKQSGSIAAKQASAQNAAATVNSAAAAAKAGMQAGKTVAKIAAGTAAGGPWGAIISAALAMRHTLFKVLVCICLAILFIIIIVVELPSIIFHRLFGGGDKENQSESLDTAYNELSYRLEVVIEDAYKLSVEKVKSLIEEGDYDYSASMAALIDEARDERSFDACYILSAYSVSMLDEATEEDMISKLNAKSGEMFPVTYEVKTDTRPVIVEGELTEEDFQYLVCTIHSFQDQAVIAAFGLDLNAPYEDSPMTYGEAIQNMAETLRKTLGD